MVNMDQFGRIGILMGGPSSEREISLKSGTAITDALKSAGCHAAPIDISGADWKAVRDQIAQAQIDLAFIALHGKFGEDGGIQSILDDLDIPYTGSGADASSISFNKTLTQTFLRLCEVPVAPFFVVTKYCPPDINQIRKKIKFSKMVVKPAREGSSIGISLVEDLKELPQALETAWQFDDVAIIEEFKEGRELTVGILNGKALPVVEIISKNKFFDFEAKYSSKQTEYIVPAKIPEKTAQEIQQTAKDAFKFLNCSDFARIDFILGKNNKYVVLEINTIPGFTATSLLPKAAKAAGINFDKLCLTLVQCAYAKKNKEIKIFTHSA